ncbi:tRNA pseudouridine(38-40) synthase TruA [Lamprobacter modestohalophilus]|uniref:tRNA pseudouridine synthase A n=1 Tax=Lamprobacter modestohalophilus TaxID=1064514 RepID=A0A9X0WD23_9GAMM|nr:tRNA pseudouridine(38-40) synthase TruA [Lamprobacter modestohalophilus]MBK1621234.1 tRNA pseudouridine(38-40) synthase TruA [Lamprobacter modestohalophilus]
MSPADPVSPTPRIALGVEYLGTQYCGWQFQHHALSVQQVLEQALARVVDQPIRVHCAGRTDAGVHATGQVVHFEPPVERPERAWTLGVNANLPDDVAVRWARPVEADFHARFSAVARHYRYLILRRPVRSALWHQRALWTHRSLAVAPMQEAAAALVGRHDFTSYRALACQAKSPVRTLHYLDLIERGDLLELRVGADGFLHHMVRNLVGVLLAIGRRDRPASWAAELLTLKDRARGGVTAPAHGLYLVRVDYPAAFGLPSDLEDLSPEARPAADLKPDENGLAVI